MYAKCKKGEKMAEITIDVWDNGSGFVMKCCKEDAYEYMHAYADIQQLKNDFELALTKGCKGWEGNEAGSYDPEDFHLIIGMENGSIAYSDDSKLSDELGELVNIAKGF